MIRIDRLLFQPESPFSFPHLPLVSSLSKFFHMVCRLKIYFQVYKIMRHSVGGRPGRGSFTAPPRPRISSPLWGSRTKSPSAASGSVLTFSPDLAGFIVARVHRNPCADKDESRLRLCGNLSGLIIQHRFSPLKEFP
jgi:hypothetical protein